jgi:hypothetical protein
MEFSINKIHTVELQEVEVGGTCVKTLTHWDFDS